MKTQIELMEGYDQCKEGVSDSEIEQRKVRFVKLNAKFVKNKSEVHQINEKVTVNMYFDTEISEGMTRIKQDLEIIRDMKKVMKGLF